MLRPIITSLIAIGFSSLTPPLATIIPVQTSSTYHVTTKSHPPTLGNFPIAPARCAGRLHSDQTQKTLFRLWHFTQSESSVAMLNEAMPLIFLVLLIAGAWISVRSE